MTGHILIVKRFLICVVVVWSQVLYTCLYPDQKLVFRPVHISILNYLKTADGSDNLHGCFSALDIDQKSKTLYHHVYNASIGHEDDIREIANWRQRTHRSEWQRNASPICTIVSILSPMPERMAECLEFLVYIYGFSTTYQCNP